MVPRAAIKEKHINPQIANKTNICTKYKYQDIFPTGDEWVKTRGHLLTAPDRLRSG